MAIGIDNIEVAVTTATELDEVISLLKENEFIVHIVTVLTFDQEEQDRLTNLLKEKGHSFNEVSESFDKETFCRYMSRNYWDKQRVAV